MGRSLKALKSPTLSVRPSNISYLTEMARQKKELGRWHNQDPVEFFCSTSNQLARIVFPFGCCEANVVSKWKCVCQAFYSPPLSCAPLSGFLPPYWKKLSTLLASESAKPNSALCPSSYPALFYEQDNTLKKPLCLRSAAHTLCAVLLCLLEALSLPWKMNGILSIVPSRKKVQEAIYNKKRKGRLHVIEIEYIGISTVLFVCKKRTQKNHDSVNRPLIGIQAY